MPTRAGWLVAVGGVTTIGVGRLLALPELYILGSIAVALVVVAVLSVRRRLPRLVVERVIAPPRVHRGGDSRVELRVGNGGRRRSPLLELHDPVAGTVGARMALAPIDAGEHRAVSYRLPTARRGRLDIGPLTATRTDPFGVASRRAEVAGATHLTVLPAVEPLHRLPDAPGRDDPLAGTSRPLLVRPGGGEFASLREYVAGDDLRRVHWPSSARAGDLLVRQEDPPWQGHVTLLLDARTDRVSPERFEYAVTAAASIVHAVARVGDRARLMISDGTNSGLVDARAAEQTLLEHLALVQLHPADQPLPRPPTDGRRDTGNLVLITGRPHHDDLDLARSMRARFGSVLVVAVETVPATDHDPGVAVAVFDDDTPFATAWHDFSAGRR
ncbi:MAG: DUF58 domain-containing protein [Actinobacteria bacterium]|nr:DUF58 domain-containing protein [Actinomycetota bacterium]